ncbi:MAG: hypothetical protein IJC76_02595 [Lachnospiraceae bacterium]|nr:hypothetical protein [Lachnospiraceae bacterium]
MGLESFHIVAVPDEVDITRDKEYWSLCGNSNVHLKNIENELGNIGALKGEEGYWIIENCIEMRLYECNEFFQGIEIRGCISCIREGSEICYNTIKMICDKVVVLKVFINNKEVELINFKSFYDVLLENYKTKIDLFNKQYDNVQLKVTSSDFYKEIRKRKKWYYKFFRK